MKKTFLFILFISVSIISCKSQIEEKPAPDSSQSLLWEISGKGLKQPSYLFGTIHLIPKEDFFLPQGTGDVFAQTDQLIMEIDLDIPMKEQLKMAQRMIIPEGKKIEDFMNEGEYQAFTQYLQDSIGLSEGKMERYMALKPFFLAGVLLTEAIGKTETYEQYFAAVAKKQKKDFLPLETLEFQLSVIDTVSIDEQVESLVGIDLMKEYNDMLDCYTSQDLNCLLSIIKSEEDADFEEAFIKTRNKNWAEKLDTGILQEKSSFIAVGCGHLPGESGLINLLIQKGYSVTPYIP